MADTKTIFDEISALLDAAQLPAVDDLEHTLTSGYAAALSLEAEGWRIERRIADVASNLGRDRKEQRELARLAERLSAARSDLSRLRALLGTLRERTEAARAAA